MIIEWYKDYPEQPYISPQRDVQEWLKRPEDFPYSKVERNKMIRLEENLLPGDIIMLWRVGFNNFTTLTPIPNYFEYRYGVYYVQSLQRLLELEAIVLCDAFESAYLLNSTEIKRILKEHKLRVGGKKEELLNRLLTQVEKDSLEKSFELRKYKITKKGKELLEKYNGIVLKHEPKML